MAGYQASAIGQTERGEPLLLNRQQAAARIGVSSRTLDRLIAAREVFSVKVGRSRRIPTWATTAYMRRLCEEQGAVDDYGLMAG